MRFQLDMKVLVKDETSKFKGERWNLVPGEEIKFNDGRGKLVTFPRPWYEKYQYEKKHSTNMMCWIDRVNNINSHRTNKVISDKQGFY